MVVCESPARTAVTAVCADVRFRPGAETVVAFLSGLFLLFVSRGSPRCLLERGPILAISVGADIGYFLECISLGVPGISARGPSPWGVPGFSRCACSFSYIEDPFRVINPVNATLRDLCSSLINLYRVSSASLPSFSPALAGRDRLPPSRHRGAPAPTVACLGDGAL